MVEQRFCKAKVGGSTPLLGLSSLKNAAVAERSIASDCKSDAFMATQVRILPAAPLSRVWSFDCLF